MVWTVFWLAVSGFPNAVAFLSPPVRSADCLGGEPVLGSPDLRVLVDGKVVAVRQRYRQARERPSRVHARDSRGIQSSASAVLQNKGPPSSQVSRFCPRERTGGRDAMATLLPPWAVAVETVLMEHWGSAQAGGMWGGHSPASGGGFYLTYGGRGFGLKVRWAGTLPKSLLRLQSKLH